MGSKAGVWVTDPKDVEHVLKTRQDIYVQGDTRKYVNTVC